MIDFTQERLYQKVSWPKNYASCSPFDSILGVRIKALKKLGLPRNLKKSFYAKASNRLAKFAKEWAADDDQRHGWKLNENNFLNLLLTGSNDKLRANRGQVFCSIGCLNEWQKKNLRSKKQTNITTKKCVQCETITDSADFRSDRNQCHNCFRVYQTAKWVRART